MTSAPLLRRSLEILSDRRGKSLQHQLQQLSSQGRGGDLRRVTAWTHGAIRHRRTLGAVLGTVAKRALKGKSDRVLGLLELLAFRALFSAESLDELLADLKRVGESKKVAAHVERVLTALEAAIAERVAWTPEAERRDDLLPLSRSEALRFKKPLLGVEQRRPSTRLAILYSLPDALVEAWVTAQGEEVAAELCRAANDGAPIFVRACSLKTDAATLLARLAEDEITATRVEGAPQALRLDEGRWRFRHTDAWREGTFLVQDLTAQRVAPLVAPEPGERILDLCAAPGGKATHLAELSGDQAQIVACDLKPNRLRKIEQNTERLGITSIETRRHDARYASLDFASEEPFDAILLDAPCSNTGVLRRRSEARWRYDLSSQRRIHSTQAELLRAALPLVRPGGRLVYSLCSIEVDEGHEQVVKLCEEHPNLILEHEELWLPTPGGGDGGYAARLRVG